MAIVRKKEPIRVPMFDNNDEFVRLPGLFRRFELEQVINFDDEFQFEPAGCTAEGTGLIVIYHRPKQEGAL